MLDLTPDITKALEQVAPRLAELLRPMISEAVEAALAKHSDPLLPIKEAAEHCGLNPAAFRQRLITDTMLQSIRQGTRRMSRFRRSDLTAWVQNVQPGRRKVAKAPAP